MTLIADVPTLDARPVDGVSRCQGCAVPFVSGYFETEHFESFVKAPNHPKFPPADGLWLCTACRLRDNPKHSYATYDRAFGREESK